MLFSATLSSSMIAIFFSRPLTLTISCFAITSLFSELLMGRACLQAGSASARAQACGGEAALHSFGDTSN
jgi:hypothetical protein